MKVKGPQKKIASVTTNIIGMKAVNKKIEKYNEILAEDSKYKPSFLKICAVIILKY